MIFVSKETLMRHAEQLVAGGHHSREGVRRELPKMLGSDWPAFAAKHGMKVDEFYPEPLLDIDLEVVNGRVVTTIIPNHGPGTELKALLAELGLVAKDACQCEARARLMDVWGVSGSWEHRHEIAGWLRESAANVGWADKFKVLMRSAVTGLWLNLDVTDPYTSLVNVSIQRARDKEGT